MKKAGLIGLAVVLSLTGCANPHSAPVPPPMAAQTVKQMGAQPKGDLLPGIWTRSIQDGVNGTEGLNLGPNGEFSLVNIYSLKGLNWRRSGDALVLTTRTEKYPEPYQSTFRIEALTDSTLTLSAPEDYLAGTYTREHGTLRKMERGKVTGTVIYYQRIALPPQALLQVHLVDVSEPGGRGVPVGTQTISHTRQVPIAFEVAYDKSAILPDHRYEVDARILVDGEPLFANASPCPVLTQGNPETVEVVVSPAR